MAGAALPPGSGAVADQEPNCRVCGTPLAGRFCERCGHDALSSEPAPPPPDRSTTPASWSVVAVADRGHFEAILAMNGPDAGLVGFPQFCPERRFLLRGDRALVGRRNPRRGIEPEIDLAGPPEDLGVSHSHALLIAQPDGSWAVVDVGSANGTYLNDDHTAPIKQNTPIPIGDGDRMHVGAWTTLILHANGGALR
jgi:hypothetical protein